MSALATSIAKARAFFWRDLRTDLSYRFTFLLELANVVIAVLAFYFLSISMEGRISGGREAFPFLLLGLAVNSYVSTALYSFSQGVRGGQKAGVLKAVLGSPVRPGEFLLYSSIYPVCRAGFDAVVYLAGGALLGLELTRMNLLAAAVMFILCVATHAGIGILSAALTLVFKKGDPIIWVYGGLSWLLGGVFYPLEVLPGWMQQVARLLPLSHALRGTRAAVLEGASLAQLVPELLSLLALLLLTLPLGVLSFQAAVRHARRTGSLGHS